MFAHSTHLLCCGVTGARPAQEGPWSSHSNFQMGFDQLPRSSFCCHKRTFHQPGCAHDTRAETPLRPGAATIFLLLSSTVLVSQGRYANCATSSGNYPATDISSLQQPEVNARPVTQLWGSPPWTAVPQGHLANSKQMASLRDHGLGHPHAMVRQRY